MKKYFCMLLAAATLCGCAPKKTFQCVAPLDRGTNIEQMTDFTLPAQFTTEDFNWMGGNLKMTLFSEDLYDAVEISQLQIGDTLIYDGQRMVVETLEEMNGTLCINGGLEEGGAWLQGYEGGTYRAVQMDDHSLYSELGKVELPLAEDLVVIDCGDNPDDPIDTISSNQKQYLESLEGYRSTWCPLNTRVVVEQGMVKEINRRWIP